MDRDTMPKAFEALGKRLHEQGLVAEVLVVGGGMIALAMDSRRLTKDIDAVFEPKAAVYAAAQFVAEELELRPDWLNDAVKGFLVPAALTGASPIYEADGIRVMTASPGYILAMKCLASRREDEDDIRLLIAHLGLSTSAQVLGVVERYYPPERLPKRLEFILSDIFGAN